MINGHKVIGVCVTKVQYRAESTYLTRLNEAANKHGYKLMIFNSAVDSDNFFDEGAKSVYSIINHNIVDVLIILSSTFGIKEIEKAIIAKAHAHGTPVILIDSEAEGCYSVVKRYGKALKSVINHIIRDHGVTDTFFLAGRQHDDPTSDFRISCYKEALAENGLPFTDDMLDYGEYWSVPARDAMDRLFASGRKLPRAIICANDYMAITVCEYLREKGLDVPRDVLVTGFGGAADAQYFTPRFTTCIEDMQKLADLTIQVIDDALEKGAPCDVYYHEMSPVISESCGCIQDGNHFEDAGHLFHMMQATKNHEGHVLSWLDRMVESNDMDDLCKMLARCIMPDSCLCLRQEYVTPIEKEIPDDIDTLCAVHYVPGDDPDRTELFHIEKMLPDLEEWAEGTTCCIFTAVFVCQTVCGYYAVKTDNVKDISQDVNRLSKIINIAFNAAINHRQQVLLLESVQNANIVNPITKLPNLKGANKWFDEFSALDENHNKALAVSIYGLPKYKYIYENYGIQDIEASLCYVAKALQKANPKNCFVAHIAEDEFAVINYYDNVMDIGDSITAATKDFFSSLEKYNADSGLEYYVEVNCGCITANPGWDSTLANFTKRATGEMYINRVKSGMGPAVKERTTTKEHYSKFVTLIDRNLFNYNFQPIVNAKNGEIFAYEALMRTHPSINMNPLEVLETAGAYQRLYSIEKATMFNVMERFSNEYDSFNGCKVFINCIPGYVLKEADNKEFSRRYSKYLEDIVFEITEQDTITDEELKTIKHLGGSDGKNNIAVDDYGTGHSNIVNLLRYSPQVIKIDRFLITDIHKDINKQMFVRSTIDLARLNGIKVLAEGVETSEELRAVISYGVDYIQGYYTGKPSPDPIASISEDIKNEILRANPLFV